MRVMILTEHHGKVYLDASTEERLHRAALSVIRGRFGVQSDYYGLGEEELREPKKPFTEEQFANVPDSLRQEADKQMATYRDEMRLYQARNNEANLILKALQEKDGKLAWKILKSRSHYMDESVEIVEVLETYPS